MSAADLTHAKLYRVDAIGAYMSQAIMAWGDLRNSTLWDASLVGAILTHADLADANLMGARLADANLTDANLERANLEDAHLRNAKLIRANLSGANLRQALLDSTDCREATFAGADLGRAYFIGTHLGDADFTEAKFCWTHFAPFTLSRVRGLESAVHNGHSDISLDTIHWSDCALPDEFLRGVGVPRRFRIMFRLLRPLYELQLYRILSRIFVPYRHL